MFIFNGKDKDGNAIVKACLCGRKYKYSSDKCYVVFKALGLDLFVNGIIKQKWVEMVKAVFEKGYFAKFKVKLLSNGAFNVGCNGGSNNNDALWLVFMVNAILQVLTDSVFSTT